MKWIPRYKSRKQIDGIACWARPMNLGLFSQFRGGFGIEYRTQIDGCRL